MHTTDVGPIRRDSAHGPELDQWRARDLAKTEDYNLLHLASCSNAGQVRPAGHSTPAKRKDESLSAYIRAGIINHQLGMLDISSGPNLDLVR